MLQVESFGSTVKGSIHGAMGRVKVALNALTDLEPRYGSRVYLITLARELSRLPQLELVLLVGSGKTKDLPSDLQRFAVEVAVPTGRSYWQLFYQRRIRRALAEAGVQVWHLPNTLPILRKFMGTVITVHDLADLRVSKYGRFRTFYRRLINLSGVRKSDLVLTVSQNSKRDLMEVLNVPSEKIAVIYPGVDETFRPLDKEECRKYIREKYSLPAEYILAPGGISGNKNVNGLLEAFSELQCASPVALVLTGDADRRIRDQIEHKIGQLGLVGKVFLTGHVPAQDIPKFYNAARLVAYVSLYEGFGFPVLESMACATAVVSPDISSIPEIAGDAALLVNPYDKHAIATALKRVLEEPNLERDLVSRGKERVRNFTWRRTALQTLESYKSIIKRKETLTTQIPRQAESALGSDSAICISS